MDVLQKGAFLLENIESPLGLNFDAEPPDPFRTDAAEEFFESAVQTLFEILDDPDGGFPYGALELGRAIF
jgi:chromatin assembly factor 1 subunit A